MKKRLRWFLAAVLIAVLIVGLGMIVRQEAAYKKGQRDYEEALSVAMRQPEEPKEPPEKAESHTEQSAGSEQETPEPQRDPQILDLEQLNWQSLWEINPDVVGWIRIPNTSVEYPILQAEDNQYYLDKTWKKEPNVVGSIFMECQNRPDLSQFNTLIYGHNMRDGSMFSALRQYQEKTYWEEHPSIYIAVEHEVRRYDVFAAYEAGVWDITYGLELEKEEDQQRFLAYGLEKSSYETGIVPTVGDEILTLSTCTGQGDAAAGNRWVVQAVWNREP